MTIISPPTVESTVQLAEAAHRGQVDKAGQPYIDHPRAVAELVREHGDNAVMAALLHDTVEDCGFTLDYLRSLGYDDEVVDAVDAVSRRPGETYMDMIRRAAAHPLGRIVKLADNTHNSGRLGNLSPDEQDFLGKRYRRARKVLEAAQTETV
jgi:(p)ppGpp synthase/HD superfamily hydrolase